MDPGPLPGLGLRNHEFYTIGDKWGMEEDRDSLRRTQRQEPNQHHLLSAWILPSRLDPSMTKDFLTLNVLRRGLAGTSCAGQPLQGTLRPKCRMQKSSQDKSENSKSNKSPFVEKTLVELASGNMYREACVDAH
jgi:hypothetical protein